MEEKSVVTGKDIGQCFLMACITVMFSLRTGDNFWTAAFVTFRHVAAYFVYGFALVFIFIALLKKGRMVERFFERKPDKVRLVKWAIGISAVLAIYQMLYELLQAFLA